MTPTFLNCATPEFSSGLPRAQSVSLRAGFGRAMWTRLGLSVELAMSMARSIDAYCGSNDADHS